MAPLARTLARMGYRASQAARVAWYYGQYAAAARIAKPVASENSDYKPQGPLPDRQTLMQDIRALFEQDLKNIEAELYAPPLDLSPNPLEILADSIRFLRDVPAVEKRRRTRSAKDLPADTSQAYPDYYLQNFHFQTDGYLSAHSAKVYDTQVEVLFTGSADAMRRQALVPLHGALAGKDTRNLKLIDIACGTGRFLASVKDNYPRLNVTALDLSKEYLDQAEENLSPWRTVDFIQTNAERMPLNDDGYNIATCIFLLHELPPEARRNTACEIARILKPGGTLILVDSLQRGDKPPYDELLAAFPVGFHEPYYKGYLTEDLQALFADAGLEHEDTTCAFLSKVMTFRKM